MERMSLWLDGDHHRVIAGPWRPTPRWLVWLGWEPERREMRHYRRVLSDMDGRPVWWPEPGWWQYSPTPGKEHTNE